MTSHSHIKRLRSESSLDLPAQARTVREYQNQDVNAALHLANVCDCVCVLSHKTGRYLCHPPPHPPPPSLLPPLPPAGPPRQARSLCVGLGETVPVYVLGAAPGGLCLLPSGAEIIFVEERGSHINSSGTCQQPPSSSDATFSSPEMTQGFREQEASTGRVFRPTTARILHPESSSSCSSARPHSPPAPSCPFFPFIEEKLEGQGQDWSPVHRWGD